MNKEQAQKQIDALRKVTDDLIAAGPEACREFLVKAGIIKEPALLFTTDDGYEIKDEEQFIFYVKNFRAVSRKAKNAVQINAKRFASIIECEKYILMNKPCLSVNEVLTCKSMSQVDLIKLAKTKFNSLVLNES